MSQEKIPNLSLRNSIDFYSSQDPGSCDTIQTDKLDFYISQKIDEIVKRQLSSFSTPHHKIVELLNSFFVDSENEKKETQKILNLKNNEIERLKTENLKLLNKNQDLEAEISRLQQKSSEIEILENEKNKLITENSKKSEELLNIIKEKNEENEENKKILLLVSEENKKLKELKEQMIKYYKKKISDLKKYCLVMSANAKKVIAKIEKKALNKEIQFTSPSTDRKSEDIRKLRTLEKDNFTESNSEHIFQNEGKFESLKLEAKSSSEVEKFCENERKGKFSYNPIASTLKILENPYQIKDFKKERNTHSCDFKETSPFKPQIISKHLKH